MAKELDKIRQQIEKLVEEYASQLEPEQFVPGKTQIGYAGRIFDQDELKAAVGSSLDFWLTLGPLGEDFEKQLAKRVGTRTALLVNSGSSANLVAFSTLCSPLMENPIKPGEEVITVAAGFPTTVNPIVQNRCLPVFVDVEEDTLNIDPIEIEKAIGQKTRAIMVAHTLGNPFNVQAISDLCDRHSLILIEDNCDGLGSLYRGQPTGSFGTMATHSFYPAHHITMGEGGAIVFHSSKIRKIAAGIRDWGRDCWCKSGTDNTCGKRFSAQYGSLPFGYDHKYVYSQIGYNLKPIEICAAIGLAQLKKLDRFIEARKTNWNTFSRAIEDIPWLRPQKPTDETEPSWFGFAISLEEGAPLSKNEVVSHLEESGIQTRNLFSGNLLRHPAYAKVSHRKVGTLKKTDNIANNTFFIGVYPGITGDKSAFIADCLRKLKNKHPKINADKSSTRTSTEMPKKLSTLNHPSPIVEEDLEVIASQLSSVATNLEGSHVVITGGTGLLGSYLVLAVEFLNRNVLKTPCQVTSISRSGLKEHPLLGHLGKSDTVQFLSFDAQQVPPELGPFNFLIHAATYGAPNDYLTNQTNTAALNSAGLINWLETAKTIACQNTLYLSSSEIYGDAQNDAGFSETTGTMINHLSERALYAESKRFGEALALSYFREFALPVTIARPFHVFGPGIRSTDGRSLANFITSAIDSHSVTLQSNGLATRSYMYLSDATLYFLKILLSARAGSIYNVANANNSTSVDELAKLVADRCSQITGKQVNIRTIPSDDNAGAPQNVKPITRHIETDLNLTPRVSLATLVDRTAHWYLDLKTKRTGR